MVMGAEGAEGAEGAAGALWVAAGAAGGFATLGGVHSCFPPGYCVANVWRSDSAIGIEEAMKANKSRWGRRLDAEHGPGISIINSRSMEKGRYQRGCGV